MQIAVIVYHKNAQNIYPAHWIEKFRESILGQTFQDFSLFEVDYGGSDYRIFQNSIYESRSLPSFVWAMNYLIDSIFNAGYDCIANTNCDDYFSIDRLEKQIPFIEQGFDIVSSNFSLVKDDEITLTHEFDKVDIQKELARNHNPICHPVICMSRNFWIYNRYIPSQVPTEDMELWKRGIRNGFKFKILPDVLCYHRLHPESIGHKLKEE